MAVESNHTRTKIDLSSEDLTLLADGGFETLHVLIGNPATIKQLALRLNFSRARVKYLIDQLMQRGLVRIHRQVHEPGRVEIYYVAAAQDVMLSVGKSSPQASRVQVMHLITSSLQRNVGQSFAVNDSEQVIFLKLVQCHMSPRLAQTFVAKLQQLADEFNAAEDLNANESFGLVFALYPIFDR